MKELSKDRFWKIALVADIGICLALAIAGVVAVSIAGVMATFGVIIILVSIYDKKNQDDEPSKEKKE